MQTLVAADPDTNKQINKQTVINAKLINNT